MSVPRAGPCRGRERHGDTGCVLVGAHPPLAADFLGLHTGQGRAPRPKGQVHVDRAGSGGQRQLWVGTNRAPVCFFPPAAAASCPGAVFSVEGAPENRAGKYLVAGHLPGPQLGSRGLVTRALRAACSPADPFDQGVVAAEEVKEEPPEPFQKIGPSMRASPWGQGWVGRQAGAG